MVHAGSKRQTFTDSLETIIYLYQLVLLLTIECVLCNNGISEFFG